MGEYGEWRSGWPGGAKGPAIERESAVGADTDAPQEREMRFRRARHDKAGLVSYGLQSHFVLCVPRSPKNGVVTSH